MNSTFARRQLSRTIATLLFSGGLLFAPSVHAANGVWNVDAAGTWSTAASWNPAAVPGTVAGDVVGLTNNITAARTVTIDTTSRIAGILNIGDSNNTHGFTLAASGGAFLTMNNNASPVQINEVGSVADSISAPIALTNNLEISAGGALNISGIISETGGPRNLTKNGAGTLTLSGVNTYSGTTAINGGVLALGNTTALGTTNSVTMAAGTTLSANAVAGSITTISAPITLSGAGNTTFSIGAGAGSTTTTYNLNGAIGGTTGNVVFSTGTSSFGNGTSRFVLNAANTYTGNTIITTGNGGNNPVFVRNGVVNGLPTTTVLSFGQVNGGGTGRTSQFDLNGFDQTLAGLDNGGVVPQVRRMQVTSATPATLTINNTSDFTFGGATISTSVGTVGSLTAAQITGSVALTKNGPGTFTLGGTLAGGATAQGNTHTGDTTILGGILVLGETLSLRNSAFDTGASSAGDATNGLRVGIGGTGVTTLTLGGLKGGNSFSSRFTTTTGGYSNLTGLTLNPGTGVTHSYSGDLGDGATAMTLTKTGAGTQVLTGSSTHTGATLVSAGSLSLSGAGDINLSSGITINGGSAKLLHTGSVAVTPAVTLTQGTLTGSGTVNTVNVGAGTGGIISNNDGVAGASLTIGALTFTGAGTVNTFHNSTSAPIVTTSLVTSGSPVTLNPTAASWAPGTYNLISFTGSYAGGGVGDFQLGTVANSSVRQAKTLGNSGTAITLTFTGVDDKVVWSGANGGNWITDITSSPTSGTPNWALKAGLTATDFWAGDNVEFNDTYDVGGGPLAPVTTLVNVSVADVSPASVLFNNSSVNYTLSGTFGVTGTTGLTKAGTGTLTITNANNYSGSTTMSGGILNANASAALGDASATNALVFNGGTLLAGGGITSPATRGVTMTGAGTIDTGTNPVTIAGVVTGAGVLTKSGTGTLILTAHNNNFTGGISINAGGGTVQATKNADPTAVNALGTGPISIGAGSTLLVDLAKITNVTDTIANSLTGAGLFKVQFAANTTARNVTIPNVTGFSGTIQLSNLGLTGDKWTASGVGTVPGSLVIDSGSTIFVQSAVPISFTGGVTLNGAGNTENRGAIRLNGATTKFGGNINLASSSTISMENAAAEMTANITSSVVGAHTLTLGAPTGSVGGILSGVISDGTGTIAVTQAAATGAYVLSGVNTYTGATTVNAGTLSISSDANLGTAPGTATPGHLSLNGGSLRTTAAMTLHANRGIDVGASNGTLNVSTGDLSTEQLTYNGIIAGVGTLTKQGIGTLILGGNNTNNGFNLGNGTTNASSTGIATANSGGYVVVNHNNALGTGPVSSRGAQLHAGTTGIVIPNVINVGVDTIGGGLRMGGTNDFTLSGAINIAGTNRSIANYTTGTPITITLNGTIDITGTSVLAGSTAMAFESSNVPNNGAKFIVNGAILGDPAKGGVATNNTFDGCELYLNNSGSTFDFLALNEGTVFVSQFGNKADPTGYLGTADSITFNTGGATLQHTGAAETSDKDFLLNAAGAINSSGSGIALSGVISGVGALTKTGTSTLTVTGANTYTGGTTISAGTLRVGTGGTVGTGPVTNNAIFTVARAGLTTAAITGTGTTDVTAASATLTASSIRQSVLSIGATSTATVAPSLGNKSAGISVFTNTTGSSLSIAAGGNFDTNDNDLIVYYQPGQGPATLATIQQQIIDGFLNTPAVAKISSSTGAVDGDKFLVAIDNGAIGLTDWEGVSLTGSNQIIAKYTLFGDLNLDGAVDSFDYSVIDSNFGTGNSWLSGDSNLDGVVNSFDYSTVDTNFGKSFPSMGGGAANLSIAAVPEPSTLVLGGLGLLGLAGLKLRRKQA